MGSPPGPACSRLIFLSIKSHYCEGSGAVRQGCGQSRRTVTRELAIPCGCTWWLFHSPSSAHSMLKCHGLGCHILNTTDVNCGSDGAVQGYLRWQCCWEKGVPRRVRRSGPQSGWGHFLTCQTTVSGRRSKSRKQCKTKAVGVELHWLRLVSSSPSRTVGLLPGKPV